MKPILSLRLQIALGLMLGILIGYLFSGPVQSNGSAGNTPTEIPSPQVFMTLPGAWMVRARFFQSSPPDIEEIIKLPEGRITAFVSGDNIVQILNAQGQVFYEQTFQVQFLSGEPPKPVNEIQQIFVLPVLEGAKTLLIITPNGETRYELPSP